MQTKKNVRVKQRGKVSIDQLLKWQRRRHSWVYDDLSDCIIIITIGGKRAYDVIKVFRYQKRRFTFWYSVRYKRSEGQPFLKQRMYRKRFLIFQRRRKHTTVVLRHISVKNNQLNMGIPASDPCYSSNSNRLRCPVYNNADKVIIACEKRRKQLKLTLYTMKINESNTNNSRPYIELSNGLSLERSGKCNRGAVVFWSVGFTSEGDVFGYQTFHRAKFIIIFRRVNNYRSKCYRIHLPWGMGAYFPVRDAYRDRCFQLVGGKSSIPSVDKFALVGFRIHHSVQRNTIAFKVMHDYHSLAFDVYVSPTGHILMFLSTRDRRKRLKLIILFTNV
jgi:hypothetical protein